MLKYFGKNVENILEKMLKYLEKMLKRRLVGRGFNPKALGARGRNGRFREAEPLTWKLF